MANNPFGNDRLERMKKTAKVHLSMEAKNSLNEVRENFPSNPEGMRYFYERFEAYYNNSQQLHPGKKVIATSCVHVPEELIYAVDAVPVRVCSGSYSLEQIGAEFLPAKSCPLIKSTLGALYINLLPDSIKPEIIIHPTSCDQKTKIGEIIADVDGKVYTLEIPPQKDTEEARQYWMRVVRKMAVEIQKVGKKKLTRKRLKNAIDLVNNAQYQYRRLHGLRKGEPVIWGKDAMLVSNAYFFDDIREWTERLRELNDELEQRVKAREFITGKRTPRILLAGSPSIFPNIKIPVMLEQLGGIVVADEFCASGRLLYDAVAVDEWNLYDMIPAVADRYLKPCMCPNFIPSADSDRKLLENVKAFDVDGVIYQSFTGCHLYDIDSIRIGKMLEKQGIPMLFIETDYSTDDTGQVTTRIEAFIESLRAKKQR